MGCCASGNMMQFFFFMYAANFLYILAAILHFLCKDYLQGNLKPRRNELLNAKPLYNNESNFIPTKERIMKMYPIYNKLITSIHGLPTSWHINE